MSGLTAVNDHLSKTVRLMASVGHACAVILVIVLVVPLASQGSHAALSLNNDQADDTAPNGAPLSAETVRLFKAVREGDLSAVQQAVLDGADLLATNADNLNASDLAESLNHFTITHFLRAYQAIEERSNESTTVVETEEPGPVPPPEVSGNLEQTTLAQTPVSGEGVVPERNTDTTAVSVTTETGSELAQASNLSSPVSSLSQESASSGDVPQQETSTSTQSPVTEQSLGDYFARLSVLNPAHVAKQPEPEAPSGQIIESSDGLQDFVSTTEPTKTAASEETAMEMQEEIPISVAEAEIIPTPEGEEQTAFIPKTPSRKPVEDTSGESAIFASIEAEQPEPEEPDTTARESTPPESLEEVDVPMLAEVPDIPMPVLVKEPSDDENSFFAQMRVFDETTEPVLPAVTETDPETEPEPVSRNAELLPEYEKIRAAVIEKLRRESVERSKQLADVRDKNLEETEQEDMIRDQLSGTQNIQTEIRAKERTALTGSSLPPGYVPPPDGGSSGIRFLQRLGLFDPEEADQIAAIQDQRGTGLPSGTSSYDQMVLMEAGENLLMPELTPGKLATKSLAFVDHGYSAPPAGRAIDTADDNAVAALGQIARLFQSPNIGYPSQTSALPSPGTLSPPVSAQGNLGETGVAQPPSSAPLNSSDLASPPPLVSSGVGAEALQQQPVTVPEIPVNPSDLAQLAAPSQQPLPDWGATLADSQGNAVSATPPAAGNNTGLTNQLSRIFDPVQTGTVGTQSAVSGGTVPGSSSAALSPAPAITGSWDVVSVQSAPTVARTLLGGAVVPNISTAATGSGALSMGQSVTLGKAPPVALDPAARKKACIDKRRGSILFCIESIDWPVELHGIMQVDTVMYQGLNAIVRYDNGVATRFHALFPSESFKTVVSYYMQRLGNPTNIWQRTISPLAAPERANPTVSWQALNPHTQMSSTLEIRQFDDTRGGFPDEKRGAVTLSFAHSGPIFPQVSAFELMRLHPGS